ncbi:MAG: cbb3-type cytochrome c oxidase subunit II [Pedosphaera sp.]|nr:cbb3-type cytochrome c oxidase subunit II [Pedosphaera sp.]
MNKAPWIFMGILFTLSLSWWGMVYGPATQLGGETPDKGDGTALKPRVGLARQGEQVYRENGCYYCHTRTATGGKFGYELQLTQLGDDRALTVEAIGKDRMSGVINQAYVIKAHKAVADAQATLKAETDKPAAAEKNLKTEQDKLKAAEEKLKTEDKDPKANEAAQKAIDELQKAVAALQKSIADAPQAIADAQKAADDAETHLSETQKFVKANDLSEVDHLTALGISGVTDTNLFSILKLPAELNDTQKELVANAKVAITEGEEQWSEIEVLVRLLKNKAGAQFKLQPVASDWPDMQNGVALRQSVSRDFLFDAHAMPGVMRIGPDLSNVGGRLMDDNAAYAHLYNPQSTGKSSHMPPYRYLFHRKEIVEGEALPSAAITVTKESNKQSVEPGYAVTPTTKAKALLAFLKSLRTDSALPEAPLVKQAQSK